MIVLLGCVCALIMYLFMEQALCRKWRKSIQTVIHVNGIRGKSTVTRMIDAALKENGCRSMAKTTGSEAAMITPNGEVRPIRRWAPANIREQLRVLKQASQMKCEYLVLECMAVNPDLQRESERMLKADIAVITNVKLDHIGVLGYTVDEVGRALLNMKPEQGVLVTSNYYEKIDENHVIIADIEDSQNFHQQNVEAALTVCRILNLDIEASMRGIKNYVQDIGHREVFEMQRGIFINGFGANDYDSTKTLLNRYENTGSLKRVILLNNRDDRHFRFLMLLDLIKTYSPDRLYVMGDALPYVKRKLVQSGYSGKIMEAYNSSDIEFDGFIVIGIGNIKGGAMTMIKEMESIC